MFIGIYRLSDLLPPSTYYGRWIYRMVGEYECWSVDGASMGSAFLVFLVRMMARFQYYDSPRYQQLYDQILQVAFLETRIYYAMTRVGN